MILSRLFRAAASPPRAPCGRKRPEAHAPAAARQVPSRAPAVLLLLLLSAVARATDYADFQALLAASLSCKHTNVVKARGDGGFLELDEQRPFSVTHRTFGPESFPVCDSLSRLAESARAGKRVFDDAPISPPPPRPPLPPDYRPDRLTGLRVETTHFEPAACRPQFHGPRSACGELQKHRRVIFVGDSMVRHMVAAMSMLLTGDLEYGALARGQAAEVYDACRCDGQFSEHSLCRVGVITFADNRQVEVCHFPQVAPFSLEYLPYGKFDPGQQAPPMGICNGTDERPVFMLLSGGHHLNCNVTETKARFVDAVMLALQNETRACPGRQVRVLWATLTKQNDAMDLLFPQQAGDKMREFNTAVGGYAAEKYGVKLIDFLPLSIFALSSYGVHFLADTNLLKATYVLEAMRLWDA